jgi:hypothetical protein
MIMAARAALAPPAIIKIRLNDLEFRKISCENVLGHARRNSVPLPHQYCGFCITVPCLFRWEKAANTGSSAELMRVGNCPMARLNSGDPLRGKTYQARAGRQCLGTTAGIRGGCP